jgi:hypothetical protein
VIVTAADVHRPAAVQESDLSPAHFADLGERYAEAGRELSRIE